MFYDSELEQVAQSPGQRTRWEGRIWNKVQPKILSSFKDCVDLVKNAVQGRFAVREGVFCEGSEKGFVELPGPPWRGVGSLSSDPRVLCQN